MKLSIISLKGIQFEGEVDSVNLKTTSGEITVLNGHQPIVTSLISGKVTIVKKDGEKFMTDIESGFLEVGENDQANILLS